MDQRIAMAEPRANLPLPIEVRQMIFELTLTQENGLPIAILSKYRSSEGPPTRSDNMGALLRVNKEIYAESVDIFYKKNAFAIGTRKSGSIYVANIHATNQFLRRSSENAQLIRKLCIHVELHGDGWDDEAGGVAGRDVKTAKKQVKELLRICEMVKKKFTGVRLIEIDICDSQNVGLATASDEFYSYRTDKDTINVPGTISAVRELVKCPELTEITFVRREWIDIGAIATHVVNVRYRPDDEAAKTPEKRILHVGIKTKRNTADDYSIPPV